MQQDEFRKWLVAQGQTEATASTRASSAKRVEQYLCDLDQLFAQEDRDRILNPFAILPRMNARNAPTPLPTAALLSSSKLHGRGSAAAVQVIHTTRASLTFYFQGASNSPNSCPSNRADV